MGYYMMRITCSHTFCAPEIQNKVGGLGSAVPLSSLKLETCAGNYETAAKPHCAI